MGEVLLEVEDLFVEFSTRDGVARAVNGVSFTVERGQTIAILGESGSGKSVTAQAVMGILDTPPARIAGGSIRLQGLELVGLPEAQYREIRGRQIAMIFQDALSALNPVISVGEQIAEMFRIHQGLDRRSARDHAIQVMKRVRIPAAEERFSNYPHEFSGGMRQRIVIAISLLSDPALIIADEPSTALDVTIQAEIMELLLELCESERMGLILISHDLGVVSQVTQRMAIMYAGYIVEVGPTAEIITNPSHPYTQGLLAALPGLQKRRGRLNQIPGVMPGLTSIPPGCPFHPRCQSVMPVCSEKIPALCDHGAVRVACHAVTQEARS